MGKVKIYEIYGKATKVQSDHAMKEVEKKPKG